VEPPPQRVCTTEKGVELSTPPGSRKGIRDGSRPVTVDTRPGATTAPILGSVAIVSGR